MDKIAVIGLACLFPDAKNPEQFWRNLLAEKDSRSMATRQEIEVDPQYFYAPNKGVYDKTYYLKGGYVRDFNFDPTGYNLSPEFLGQLDKLFQWSLYVAREALADSGYLASNPNPSNLKEMGKAKCGVIMGNLSYPTRLSRQLFTDIYRQAMQPIIQNLLGQDDFILQTTDIDTDVRKSKLLCSKPLPYNALVSGYLTTVIAQALGLSQVNFSIDAACASSLYAVKLACYYLQAGKADLMLAGGISAPAPLFVTLGFASLQGYPDNGISQPLDKQSKGLTSGEGAGMVVLKRYADAVRDGDKIQAVIPAIGLSNDGRGKHLLIPNPRGQQLAFERAYREAGISPTEIAYVECHATGTPVGDNIELNSTADFFGQYNHIPLISSVKTNVGHLLTAAGIVSMLKAILAMQHGIIPPTIGINDPLVSSNKQITDSHLIRTAVRWTEQGNIKRSAVSAFGFGGTNAHMVLEYHTSNPSHLKGRSKAPHPNPSPFKERDNWRGAKLAIVGMGAYFGQCDDLESYAETIHSGKQHFIPLPPQRWHGLESNSELMHEVGFDEGKAPLGAYIESFEIDAFRGKIPPNEAHTIHPQQLLMLRVTNQALEDAGYTLKDKAKNVAVIIAMETDPSLHRVYSRWDLTWQLSASLKKSGLTLPEEKLTELEILLKDCTNYPMGSNQCLSYIGNVMASRISSLWNFTCPSFTLSAEENSVFRALEVAQILLEMEEVESVVVGAVDLAGGFEHVVLQQKLAPMNTGKSTMSFDHDVNGWLVGEGAGAVVLKRADNVQKAHDKIYAVIESVSLVQSPNNVDFEIQPQGVQKRFCTPHVEMHTPYIQAMQEAFAQADVSPHEIGYVEVCGSGIDWQDEAEMDGLHAVYRHDAKSKPLSCAIGSVKANIGHTFVASGMASLIKTALCLHQKYIPATPNWSAPKRLAEWQKSPFYIATESRPWFVVQPQKHLAAIGSLSIDGTAGHVVLSGASTHIKPRFDAPGASQSRFDIESGIEHALRQEGPFILPIGANDESEIYRKIRALRENIEHADSLSQLAQETFGTFQNQGDTRYVACLVGKNKVELDKQIKKAMSGIRHAFETNLAWQTPQGSYFTPNPLGETGEIAFVYPGAFNSYLGIAREMFQLFPQTHNYLHKITPDIGFSMDDKLVYPRSLTAINQDNKRAFEEKLKTDSVAMIKSCLTCDTLFTKILRHTFKLEPNSAFGYSLGETGMFWGLDVWDDASNSHHLLANSELYTTRLSGPHNAIREAWRIPAHVSDDEIWKTYIVLAPVALVQSIVNLHRQVFIIIINTNHEVVIAGNPKACRQVIRQLDCRYMEIEANDAIHCPPIKSEYGEFVHLHTYEINDIKNIKFYSSAYHDQLPLTYDGIPRTIAEMACNQVDFPRLVQRVYDDGARIFVELGPGRTCTRWIGENLKGQPHLATAINKKGVADYTGLIRMLTKLVSHKVKLDVSPLYRPTSNQSKRKGIFKTITLGGNRLADTILTDENRDKFMPFVGKQELGVGSSDLGATTLALSEETTPDSSGVTKPHFVMDTEIMKDETQRSTDEMTLREDKSQESGVRSQESGVRSQESGVRSQESGVRSQESGIRSQESGIRNQESGVRSHQESGVRSQESGVRSQESKT
ncbi:MAG: hypothetical protein B6242_10465 [Anaerolineaceae bacterium 4572_78]|nr:MAG: hypothetical protein B6242_10465 [Anaerolineaceae bacterium 4572_78]